MSAKFKRNVVELLEGIGVLKGIDIEGTLEKPPQPDFGDFSSNVCFSLSKKLKKSPKDIAEEIASQIQVPEGSFISRVEAKAGYVNFFFDRAKFAEAVLKEIVEKADKYGSSDIGEGKKTIVEFPSVNPGKPWHIGHGRNAILGDSVRRVLIFSGFNVEAQDYIDDLGLQVAQFLWGLMNLKEFPEKKGLLEKIDQWQGRVYVEVANLFKEDEKVQGEVKEIMKKIEDAHPDVKDLHRKVVDECVRAQYETGFRLHIYHNVKIHESDIVKSGLFEKVMGEIKKSDKIIFEDAGPNKGCLVAKLEHLDEFKGMKSPDKILIRSDGTSTYTGKDVAFQLWKFGLIEDPMKYKEWIKQPNNEAVWTTAEDGKASDKFASADMVVNVIGSEQNYPQRVVYNILKLLGREKEYENSIHLAYEHVWFKEKGIVTKFSGRKGTWVGYSVDEVLNKLVGMATEEVKKRNEDMPEDEIKDIAEKVGVAALRYAMLRSDWSKKIAFDWDEVLSFEGNTGPYIQYAYVRANKILQKAGEWQPEYESDVSDEERELIGKLADFPAVVQITASQLRPHIICDYVHDLAESFSKFYHACPVLKSEQRNFRLTLVKATKIVLKNCLYLLGMEAPEMM